MNKANFVIMGKGGVGKSFVAWLLGQYGIQKGHAVYCADTDPSNGTFSQYAGLNAEYIQISDEAMMIDRRKFDDLTENLAAHEGFSVVDNGAATFLPLMSYVTENGTFDLLEENGCSITIHAPIVGGSAMVETLLGLKGILENTCVKVVIWENEYFGKVAIEGKDIRETQLFNTFKSRIAGVVTVAAPPGDTLAEDLKALQSKRLLMSDVVEVGFKLAARQRIINFQRRIFEQLEAAGV